MSVKSNVLFIIGLVVILHALYFSFTNPTMLTNFFSIQTIIIIQPIAEIFLGLSLCVVSLFFNGGNEDTLEAEIGLRSIKLKKTKKEVK
ncbi:MAG TPA: hypothetical protein VI977_05610 [archaeon]|nr:hypothetical protein [archaeon]